MSKPVLLVSDIHLDADDRPTVQRFISFLNHKAIHAHALYILGDFFEFWVGDDNPDPLIDLITKALNHLSQSVPIYLMRGNRDFLIHTEFARKAGCQLIMDPCVVNLFGTPVLLTHGDRLCTQDVLHHCFRWITQRRSVQRLFLALPLALRLHLAHRLRKKSRQRTQKLPQNIMDVDENAVKKDLLTHQVRLMIHGHTHRPQIHHLSNPTAHRVVLGAWHHAGSVVEYHPNHSYRLLAIQDTDYGID